MTAGAPLEAFAASDRRLRAQLPLEVTSLEQLAALAKSWPQRWFATEAQIFLRIPSQLRDAQAATEKRLNFWREVCGCQVGALFVLASLTWYVLGPAREAATILSAVWHGGAFVLGMGILGKIAAILFARALFVAESNLLLWRLRRLT